MQVLLVSGCNGRASGHILGPGLFLMFIDHGGFTILRNRFSDIVIFYVFINKIIIPNRIIPINSFKSWTILQCAMNIFNLEMWKCQKCKNLNILSVGAWISSFTMKLSASLCEVGHVYLLADINMTKASYITLVANE